MTVLEEISYKGMPIISPKKEAGNGKDPERKGVLKFTPSREPAAKVPKIDLDGAEADDTKTDEVMGIPPPLPSEFGGSVSHVPPGFCPEERRENPVAWTGNIQDPSKNGAGAGGSGAGGSEGGAGGSGAGGSGDQGGKEEKDSVSLGSLMEELKKFTVNVDGKFDSLQRSLDVQASDFKKELGKLREEMVSRSEFDDLVQKVRELQSGGLPNSQITWMQDQLNRFDSANKSLAFMGFKDNNAENRIQSIESYLKKMGEESHLRVVDHVYTGGPGNRHMAPLSIVEFPSLIFFKTCFLIDRDGNSTIERGAI